MASAGFQRTFVDYHNECMAVIESNLADKLNEAGDLIRDSMKEECPVDSGALKKSIRIRRDLRNKSVKIIAGNKKAWYVHLVLFGTRERMTGSPKERKTGTGVKRGSTAPNNFMQRALDKNLSKLKAIFGRPINSTQMAGTYKDIQKVSDAGAGLKTSAYSEIDNFIRDNA